MIESFRHKGLQRLFEEGSTRGVNAEHVDKIEDILGLLNVAVDVRDMDRPSFRLHSLRSELKGYWAVTVRGNWRIVFRFKDGNAFDVDLVDYH